MSVRSRPPGLICVITDQQVNHDPHLAFVEAIMERELGPGKMTAHHQYVPKQNLTAANLRGLISHLRRKAVMPGTPLVLFRDSECRDDRMRTAAAKDLRTLVLGLQDDGFIHTTGLLLSPFSEAALLLCETWLGLLPSEVQASVSVARHIRGKRQGHVVHKDQLEMDMRLNTMKRDLNARWAAEIRRSGLPMIELQCYFDAVDQVSMVIAGSHRRG